MLDEFFLVAEHMIFCSQHFHTIIEKCKKKLMLYFSPISVVIPVPFYYSFILFFLLFITIWKEHNHLILENIYPVQNTTKWEI